MGAAMLTGQADYPEARGAFPSQQVTGTYSAFLHGMEQRALDAEQFASQVATVFRALAARQERLGTDFESAIFSNLESLYED